MEARKVADEAPFRCHDDQGPKSVNANVPLESKCEELEPSISGPVLPSKADVRATCLLVAFVPFWINAPQSKQ
jgi:hypothetical protein